MHSRPASGVVLPPPEELLALVGLELLLPVLDIVDGAPVVPEDPTLAVAVDDAPVVPEDAMLAVAVDDAVAPSLTPPLLLDDIRAPVHAAPNGRRIGTIRRRANVDIVAPTGRMSAEWSTARPIRSGYALSP